jgi:hypothetical protein
MRVEDEASDFVDFKGDDRFFQENSQRQIGKGHLSGDAFYGIACCHTREFVP